MRVDIVNIVNELSYRYTLEARMAGVVFSYDDEPRVLDMYEIIFDHCKNTKSRPRSHTYGINNGVLTIDGKNIRRVAGMINKPGYMRISDTIGIDYEGLILARQEACYG